MAKRKYSKAKKMQPAVTRLWFHIDSGNDTNYIDLSLAASAANRRFYRQGLTWAVAGMKLHTFPSGEKSVTGNFDVSKIPETWMAANAHTKAKKLWMKSQDQVLDDQPSIAAKYRDFKINLDKDMLSSTIQDASANAAGDGEIMLPVDRQDFTAKYGEWIYSTFQLPTDGGSAAPDEVQMHMVGPNLGTAPNLTSVGLIHGYGLARSRPQLIEPNTPTDGGWMTEVFDVADNLDEIRLDVSDNNDVPPYRVGDVATADEYYPGGVNNQPSTALHAVEFITSSTIGGVTSIPGGIFPCGLMRFDWSINESQTSMYLAVDLVPGTHKGYLAEEY
jgi:hypothetical protein